MTPFAWRGEAVSHIILGTAQLGMDYGVANRSGKPDAACARSIVEAAWGAGIRHFDTAQAYGDSEAVLGRAMRELGIARDARVTTKLAVQPSGAALAEEAVEQSLDRLGVEQLWCFMLHTPKLLDYWERGLGETLIALRSAGHIRHLGVSLSDLADADRCLANPELAVLQLPCNAWDRRPVRSGLLARARRAGRLCCARSLYLQGLLTVPPLAAASRLPPAREASECWHAFAAERGISPVELAMRFGLALGVPLVVGAETPGQIRETIRLAQAPPLPTGAAEALAERIDPLLNDLVLSPWRWPPSRGA